MVLVQVARQHRRVAVLHVHADETACGNEIIAPAHAAVSADELLDHDITTAEVQRGATRRHCLKRLCSGSRVRSGMLLPRDASLA